MHGVYPADIGPDNGPYVDVGAVTGAGGRVGEVEEVEAATATCKLETAGAG